MAYVGAVWTMSVPKDKDLQVAKRVDTLWASLASPKTHSWGRRTPTLKTVGGPICAQVLGALLCSCLRSLFVLMSWEPICAQCWDGVILEQDFFLKSTCLAYKKRHYSQD